MLGRRTFLQLALGAATCVALLKTPEKKPRPAPVAEEGGLTLEKLQQAWRDMTTGVDGPKAVYLSPRGYQALCDAIPTGSRLTLPALQVEHQVLWGVPVIESPYIPDGYFRYSKEGGHGLYSMALMQGKEFPWKAES